MSVEEFDREVGEQEADQGRKVFWLNILDETVKEFKTFLVTSFNQLALTLKKNTFDVNVTNQEKIEFPKVQKVEVTNHKEFPKDIKVSNLSDIKIPEAKLVVPDSITVKNFPKQEKFPEVRFPKSMEVSNMREIVKEIKTIVDKIPKEIKLKQGLLDKTPKVTVNTDNTELLAAVRALQEAFKALADRKYPETDFNAVIEAIDKTTHSLDTLEFPVPQVTSSWQKSLTMQSEDLACTYVWKMVGTKEVLDYKEFTAEDGNTYRKTLTYNSTAKPTYQTEWEKQ
jgi:hypothetical protein